MCMTMTIIMTMNIYITQDNESNLRGLNDYTMSGLVNHLLTGYFKTHTKDEVKAVEEKIVEKVEYLERNAPEIVKKADNPFTCRKCGSMLVAGKCLTKH